MRMPGRMTLRQTVVLALLWGSLGVGSEGGADTVTVAPEATREGTVTAIDGQTLTLDGRQTVPWATVRRVVLNRTPVVMPDGGLVLRDGTRLGGLIREIVGGRCTFRSVTAGTLTVPVSDLAALYFVPGFSLTELKTPAPGKAVVAFKAGGFTEGVVTNWSTTHLLVQVGERLNKVALADVRYLALAALPAPSGIGLRNGDRVCRPVTWQQDRFTVELGGRPVQVGLAAVAEIVGPAPAK